MKKDPVIFGQLYRVVNSYSPQRPMAIYLWGKNTQSFFRTVESRTDFNVLRTAVNHGPCVGIGVSKNQQLK